MPAALACFGVGKGLSPMLSKTTSLPLACKRWATASTSKAVSAVKPLAKALRVTGEVEAGCALMVCESRKSLRWFRSAPGYLESAVAASVKRKQAAFAGPGDLMAAGTGGASLLGGDCLGQ